MAKTIKVIDLFNKIANNEELPKKVLILDEVYYLLKDDEGNVMYSQSKQPSNWEAYIDRSLNLVRCLNEDVIILDDETEIIQEQQDIDIQEIEEIKDVFIENASCGEDVKYLARKCNEILKWAKQIDKNIKDKE